MKTKNFLTVFIGILVFVLLAGFASADTTDNRSDFDSVHVFVDDVRADITKPTASVVAGNSVVIEVYFRSLVNESDIRVKVEIEGDKLDVDARTELFDVESGYLYKKVLTLRVPHELKNELSDTVDLNVKIWGSDSREYDATYELHVQRPSYQGDIKSVSFPSTISPGDSLPVDVVVKNIGYNELEDLFVKISIPELGLHKTAFFGDIISDDWNSKCCDDEEDDTVSGRIYLEIPFGVASGEYTLEVMIENDDTSSTEAKKVYINNEVPETVLESGDSIILVNPTRTVMIYKIISPSGENIIVVPAGSSQTYKMTESGEYLVFADSKLLKSVSFKGDAPVDDNNKTNSTVVLIVILAILLVVLLVILIVLLTNKSEKSQDVSESYY